MMLKEPAPITSVASFITVAPRDLALPVAAFRSSTCTYAIHAEGAPGMGFFIMPPPVPSPTLIIVYVLSPTGMSASFQSKSFP